MPCQEFAVETDLSFAHCEELRPALALVREVMAEVRRLQANDERLVGRRLRIRRRRRCAQVILRVRAGSSREAFEIATATLRTSVHAAGGSTAGWEDECPRLAVPTVPAATWQEATRPGRRARDPLGWGADPSWAGAAATVARKERLDAPLPRLAPPASLIILP